MKFLVKLEAFLRLIHRKSKSAVKRFFKYAHGHKGRRNRDTYHTARSQPLLQQVLYESFDAKSVSCNPEAIFRNLVIDDSKSNLVHIWAVRNFAANSTVIREYSHDKRVRFVKHGSREYWTALARSKFLVNNVTFPAMFFRREGQVYLNTWHGTPLKSMGFEVPRGSYYSRNVFRNFLQATHILSSGPWMTQRIYAESYKFTPPMLDKVVEGGSPRVDVQFDPPANARELLSDMGVKFPAGNKVILWAPTWRGSSVYSPKNDTLELSKNLLELNETLSESGVTVLLKAHQTVSSRFASDPDLKDFLVPNTVPTNLLLSQVDALITDYSSIYFDFLISNKTIFVHCNDLDEYLETQGLIVDPTGLPDYQSSDLPQLLKNILKALDTGFVELPSDERSAIVENFLPYEDGHASKFLINSLFDLERGVDKEDSVVDSGKKRVIIFPGGMDINGISTSAVNFASSLSPEKYDVSILFTVPPTGLRRNLVDSLPPHIRIIERVGGLAGTVKETRHFRTLMQKDPKALLPWGSQSHLSKHEYERVLGNEEFDIAIDFQGYNVFWSIFIMHTNAKKRLIWQHNDLFQETQKVVDGQLKHAHNLQAVFAMYEFYDYIVSVSEQLSEVNSSSLSGFASTDRFVSLKNLIDEQKVLENASAFKNSGEISVQGNLLSTLEKLNETYSHDELTQGLSFVRRSKAILGDDIDRPFIFMTVGRLSPEKNHLRLIDAFKIVHETNPATKLVIVGGGPLKRELESYVKLIGLSKNVVLTGFMANPHQLLTQADTFVLSSDYEGQPMVILEARILSLPIVTVNFGSVLGSVTPQEALITESTVDALATGMEMAISGDIPQLPFDVGAYNSQILEIFESWVTT